MAYNHKINLPWDHPFDYQLVMQQLAGRFRAPRNKLASLIDSGEILRVKKGLYIQSQATINPLVLAGLIYGPSYVSLETALAHHGMIPERVEEITCLSTKRPRLFETPLGRYSYRSIAARTFLEGVSLEKAEGGSYLLASPEKALCDRVALIRNLKAQRDVPSMLTSELRIDLKILEKFDQELVARIAQLYRRPSVSTFALWLKKHLPS